MAQTLNPAENLDADPDIRVTPSSHKTASIGLGSALSIASLFAVILASLGYGISLSVESEFGLPHATAFTSAFELIDLSSVAIMAMLDAGLTKMWSIDGFLLVTSKFWVPALILFSCWGLLFVLARTRKWSIKKSSMPIRSQTWFRTPTSQDSWLQFFQSFVWPTTATLTVFSLTWLTSAALFAIPVAVAILPSIGHELGKAHIEKWIVGAEICHPLSTRDARQKSKPRARKPLRAVDCVALSKDGKMIAEGLVVLATSTAIILYNPITGAARRERTDGISIETIEDPSWFKVTP